MAPSILLSCFQKHDGFVTLASPLLSFLRRSTLRRHRVFQQRRRRQDRPSTDLSPSSGTQCLIEEAEARLYKGYLSCMRCRNEASFPGKARHRRLACRTVAHDVLYKLRLSVRRFFGVVLRVRWGPFGPPPSLASLEIPSKYKFIIGKMAVLRCRDSPFSGAKRGRTGFLFTKREAPPRGATGGFPGEITNVDI